MSTGKRGAKRKAELDLDVERTAYASFVQAANAVSQLYTAGVREQRRTAKATLVRRVSRRAAAARAQRAERALPPLRPRKRGRLHAVPCQGTSGL